MIAFVTGLDNDSPCIREAVHQLITLGIPFSGWEAQQLLTDFPADLARYDALITDRERLRRAGAEERRLLEVFAMDHCVHIIPEEYNRAAGFTCDALTEIDFHLLAAASGLDRQEIPEIPTETILEWYLKNMEEFFRERKRFRHLNEYHLHCTESLLEMEKLGRLSPEWSRDLTDFFNDMERLIEPPGDIDGLAAWSLAPLSVERCGHRRILDKVLAAAEDVVHNWARSDEGLLCIGGRRDDPLLLAHPDSPFFGFTRASGGLRNLILNELLHYFGAAFPGLTTVSGDPKFLEEAVKLMRYVDRIHRDPADGLLRHASLHGQPLGEKWGRGNTHAMMGVFYLLKNNPDLPADVRAEAAAFLDKTGRGLLKYQTDNGLWHNVIDREDTPEETSCSVLITLIFAYGANHGWFPKDRYAAMIRKSSHALRRKFWRGCGSGNCRGTMPSPETSYYLRRPIHMYRMPLIAPALIESEKLIQEGRSKS